jgi:hypothetical protein
VRDQALDNWDRQLPLRWATDLVQTKVAQARITVMNIEQLAALLDEFLKTRTAGSPHPRIHRLLDDLRKAQGKPPTVRLDATTDASRNNHGSDEV